MGNTHTATRSTCIEQRYSEQSINIKTFAKKAYILKHYFLKFPILHRSSSIPSDKHFSRNNHFIPSSSPFGLLINRASAPEGDPIRNVAISGSQSLISSPSAHTVPSDLSRTLGVDRTVSRGAPNQ